VFNDSMTTTSSHVVTRFGRSCTERQTAILNLRMPRRWNMDQLPLFSVAAHAARSTPGPGLLDADSEHLLTEFQAARRARGAHHRSVRREVSQLRSIVRDAALDGRTVTLRTLVADLALIARVLTEPATPVARSTGRARLLAVQRFIELVGRSVDRDPAEDLAALDALLPAHRSAGWHSIGLVVAGATGRRRRRGPTLDGADLRRIVDAAGTGKGGHADRDRALAALHCFSGLRPEEIVRLHWEDLATELTENGHYGLTAIVDRGGRMVTLLLPEPASAEVAALAMAMFATIETLSGPVLCARGARRRPLSYRAARDVLHKACRRAGLPVVDAASLRATCAHWLRGQGLSDHEVASVLGLARVRSVDRLLQHHVALDAQRVVRERLAR